MAPPFLPSNLRRMYHPAMRASGVAIALAVLVAAGCKRNRDHSGPSRASATVISCSSAGCPAAAATPPADGGELVMWVDAEPAFLCDLIEHDAWSRWIVENQVVETLLQQDPWTGEIAPRLAERHELTADALTLHLRRGVKWHDGQPFTAADVAFTINRRATRRWAPTSAATSSRSARSRPPTTRR